MPDLSILATPAPYHVLAYGLLLGTQVFNSFIAGIVSYKTLPRPQFASLQSALFPIYFAMQAGLPPLLALTYPSKPALSGSGSGIGIGIGIADASARQELLSLAAVGAMGAANWLVVGPATTKVMRQRKSQEVRDGKKSYDVGPHSEAMNRLNKQFGKLHGISSLLNLGAVLGTIWYGVLLAERI